MSDLALAALYGHITDTLNVHCGHNGRKATSLVRELSASGTLPRRVPRPTALYRAPALRSIRLRRMLTQREVVEGAHVPRSVIAKLEADGYARPDTIRKLARFLEVEPEDLMRAPPTES